MGFGFTYSFSYWLLKMDKPCIFITGGAGFIGSHVVRRFVTRYPEYHIVNVDALTYAGNLENLKDIASEPNYTFVKLDITDVNAVNALFETYQPVGVIHLAAESHVDRSISDPLSFVHTNIIGTVNLLQACKTHWTDYTNKRFYHISTDEVFGSLELGGGFFTETTPYSPRSPYSASKASSDHLVMAYHHTYHLPVVMSNCSNNYGPHQFPEKLIPLMIHNIQQGKPLPVYGTGENVRDWLYVEDHAEAIDLVYHKGLLGESYNIGGDNEYTNLELVHLLCSRMDQALNRPQGTSAKTITFVTDRAGHDLRYAIDFSKIKATLGWTPSTTFEQGLSKTIDWYLSNTEWLNNVTSGVYQQYYKTQYEV
jgi:dTDP-glucose 4,6-dehydratase